MASQFRGTESVIPENTNEIVEQDLPSCISVEKGPISVFVNHIDSRFGASVVRYFGKQDVIGSTSSEDPDVSGVHDKEEDITTSDRPYSFLGTLSSESTLCDKEDSSATVAQATSDLPTVKVVDAHNRSSLVAAWTEATWIIYDIAHSEDAIDQALAAFEHLYDDAQNSSTDGKIRVFALVSTFMTWARTSQADPTDESVPLTEDEAPLRQPHPHFKRHLECEKHVLRHANDCPTLRVVLLSSGVQYGDGEGLLEYLFRTSWIPHASAVGIPIFGAGDNRIPTIHIADCCRMLEGVIKQTASGAMEDHPLVIACDGGKATLLEMASAIVAAFTSDGAKNVYTLDPSEAYLFDELSQLDIDTLTAHVPMEANLHAGYARTHTWCCSDGFVANVNKIRNEYVDHHLLQPMRICVAGPPSTGKTTLCQQISARFGIAHVDAAAALEYTVHENTVRASQLDAKVQQLRARVSLAGAAAIFLSDDKAADVALEDEILELETAATAARERVAKLKLMTHAACIARAGAVGGMLRNTACRERVLQPRLCLGRLPNVDTTGRGMRWRRTCVTACCCGVHIVIGSLSRPWCKV
eukprot:m.878833 g.878833  ORF g.878833 m.878833 type:complete len:584 (-) comp23587_c1_seq37:2564-4315(-)